MNMINHKLQNNSYDFIYRSTNFIVHQLRVFLCSNDLGDVVMLGIMQML